jgi:hypothetical protein
MRIANDGLRTNYGRPCGSAPVRTNPRPMKWPDGLTLTGEDLRVTGASGGSQTPRIDHQAQRKPLQLGRRWRRHAINRRQHATLLHRRWNTAVPDLSLQLELNETIERNRHRRMALDVDALFADIACDHGGKSSRPSLVLPGQAGRKSDGLAVVVALIVVWHARASIKLRARCYSVQPTTGVTL